MGAKSLCVPHEARVLVLSSLEQRRMCGACCIVGHVGAPCCPPTRDYHHCSCLQYAQKSFQKSIMRLMLDECHVHVQVGFHMYSYVIMLDGLR